MLTESARSSTRTPRRRRGERSIDAASVSSVGDVVAMRVELPRSTSANLATDCNAPASPVAEKTVLNTRTKTISHTKGLSEAAAPRAPMPEAASMATAATATTHSPNQPSETKAATRNTAAKTTFVRGSRACAKVSRCW